MSDLRVEMVCTIKIGADAQESVEAMNAMLDSGFRVRSLGEAEFVLEKSVPGDEFLAQLGKDPIPAAPATATARVKRTYKKRKVQSAAAETTELPAGDTKRACYLCQKPLRALAKDCPKCKQPVCTSDKIAYRGGICKSCFEPSQRRAIGRPKKYGGEISNRKPPADIKPATGSICEGCDKFKAVIKCASCAKMICRICAQRYNAQCKECASVPA